jgi:hypothetical protein
VTFQVEFVYKGKVVHKEPNMPLLPPVGSMVEVTHPMMRSKAGFASTGPAGSCVLRVASVWTTIMADSTIFQIHLD